MQILQKYNQQLRVPALPDVVGSGDASGGSEGSAINMETLTPLIRSLCQALCNPPHNAEQNQNANRLYAVSAKKQASSAAAVGVCSTPR